MTVSNKTCILGLVIPRFGDAYNELPAQCLMGMPVLAPDHWTRFPTGAYEALVGDLMGMGVPVAGHPAACAREGCAHPQIWHAHKTRDHKCQIAGCQCAALIRQETPR